MMTFEEALEPLFRYVDSLTDEERDRIVTGQGWEPGSYIRKDGNRCLVGHVFAITSRDVHYWAGDVPMLEVDRIPVSLCVITDGMVAYEAFDRACRDFTTERVVAALKKRAGAGPTSATVQARAAEVATHA